MKNETIINATATATAEKTFRPSTLCKILIANDDYTNRFISKSNGETLFNKWKSLALAVRNAGHNLNAVNSEGSTATAEEKAECEKAFYTALSAVYAEIGDIPTADGKQGKKLINGLQATTDSTLGVFVRAMCSDYGRKEKDCVQTARKERAEILKERDATMKDERKKLFSKNGNVYNGISASAVSAYNEKEESYAKKVKTADDTLTALLNKKGNSVFDCVPTSDGAFLRKFEIVIRKAVKGQTIKTLSEIKAERAERNKKTDSARKAQKTDSKKKTQTAGKAKTDSKKTETKTENK